MQSIVLRQANHPAQVEPGWHCNVVLHHQHVLITSCLHQRGKHELDVVCVTALGLTGRTDNFTASSHEWGVGRSVQQPVELFIVAAPAVREGYTATCS
eukprot:538617-Prymnesium_polylepis.1